MLTTDKFINWLRNRTNEKLPGINSQKKMAPLLDGTEFRNFNPPQKTRNSAVIAILFNKNDFLHIIFTLRSDNLNSHKGQVSFPGGMNEQGETLLETALRETREEIGLELNNNVILLELSPLYVPPSNTIIQPFLAYVEGEHQYIINNDEVESVIEFEFSYFLNNDNVKFTKWVHKGENLDVPFWDINAKSPLWGATSMIMSEIIDLYKEFISIGK